MSEQTTTTNQPAQGWYADPHDAGQLRWWDGNTWTEHVHTADGNGSSANGSNGTTAAAAGDGSAVSEWLAVRSNQILLLVLIIAIALFAFVMLGGGA